MEVVKRRLPFISLLLVGLMLLAACSQSGVYTKGYFHPGSYRANTASSATTPSKDADYYIVQKGETLYSIAWQNGYDHRQLASWNGIKPPYTIFPLQRIRVTPPPVAAVRSSTLSRKSTKPSYSSAAKPIAVYRPKNEAGEKLIWHWPARGRLLSTFSSTDAGRKGVDIGGRLGQPVQAAAAGKVVYSGSGLRGYGNLIIVKHNEEFFSAYAHNNKNLVKENQNVKAGQQIADMGQSGADKVQLHFEIRRDGKPVNPLSYLPKYRK